MPKNPPNNSRPLWIVHKVTADGMIMTPRRKGMKLHRSSAAACAEADRLAGVRGATFMVFEPIHTAHPPAVINRPAAAPPKPVPALVDKAPTKPKPAARTVAVETRRRLRKSVISRKEP